jgi:hypothetical protein
MTAPVTVDAVEDLVVAALQQPGRLPNTVTIAYPRDWKTPPALMPLVMVQSPRDASASLGRGAPQFITTATISVVGRIWAKANTGDAGAAAAKAAVDVLLQQCRVAIINDFDLFRVVQQCAAMRSVSQVKAEGEYHLGEFNLELDLEFYQASEDFQPVAADPIEEFAVYADLVNVFSASGDFTGDPEATPFVDQAEPPPRTAGPDGRAEGAVIIPNT